MSRKPLLNSTSNVPHPEIRPFQTNKQENNLRPSALSVDTVNLCNLRCKHCFWDSYDETIEHKINPNLLEHVKACLEKYPSITNITWYGGEPLINAFSRRLVEEGIQLNKKNNLVITNGTFKIPDWQERTHFAVSIDGDQKTHDAIRGQGVYTKAKANILDALKRKVPVAILFCLNALNIDSLPKVVGEWSQYDLEGIVITSYASLKEKPHYLKMTDYHKEKAADILIRLKEQYNDAICNSKKMIEYLRPKYDVELALNCPMNVLNTHSRIYSIHMSNDGKIRKPCALGADVDCFSCRSVTKMALYAGMVKRDRESIQSLLRMYHSKYHQKMIKSMTLSLNGRLS